MASLYIHIPFCERKCIYCDFYSIAPQDSSDKHSLIIERFLAALEKEIVLRSEELRFHTSYKTVFFGGGTPSILSPSDIDRIMNGLVSHFSLEPHAEITIETNPGTVNLEKLKAFRSMGINRLSIGVQSFRNEDLQFLTRIHTAEEAKQCMSDASAAGFDNISVDLIFSLPYQTIEHWHSNLVQALAHSLTHISCYSLILEPTTPLFRMVQSKQITPLDTEHDAELYEFTIEFLSSHGFKQYEVSNFARPGFRCRHNINYWSHNNYLGFGPSAHSLWDNERWWNSADIITYADLLNKGVAPLSGGEHLTEKQLMDEAIFLGLRSDGISIENYSKRFQRNFLEDFQSNISHFERQGLMQIENNRLHLTPKGYLLCDEICQSFCSMSSV